jgi:hypothetical protein
MVLRKRNREKEAKKAHEDALQVVEDAALASKLPSEGASPAPPVVLRSHSNKRRAFAINEDDDNTRQKTLEDLAHTLAMSPLPTEALSTPIGEWTCT